MAATPALAGFEVGYLSQDGVEHRAKTRLVSEAARSGAKTRRSRELITTRGHAQFAWGDGSSVGRRLIRQ